MKKSSLYFAAAVAIATLGACSDDMNFQQEGQGRLILSARINSELNTGRQASEAELSESCKIWISKADKGVMYKYTGINEFPTQGLWLTSGNYVAEVWAGDSVSASFDDRYFKGRTPFEITAGGAVSVEVNCKIANVVVAPSYTTEINEMFSEYTMTVGHSRGKLVYEGENATSRGYFMMPSTDTDLTYKFEGTLLDGTKYTREGVLASVQAAKLYTLKVKHTTDYSPVGGGYFDIEVDTTDVEVNDGVVISVAPTIAGYSFNINDPQYYDPTVGFRQQSIYVTASTRITRALIESDDFSKVFGYDGNDVELYGCSDAVKDELNTQGIVWAETYDDTKDVSALKLTFREAYFEKLDDGIHAVKVTITDANGKTSVATFKFNITLASVENVPANLGMVTTRTATLTARVTKTDDTGYGFKYRSQAASRADDWLFVEATVAGNQMTATITDLEPGTIYEYMAVSDSTPTTEIFTFNTEAELQLPNAGFEGWQLKTPYLVYAAGEDMFWDTGNHGSATMSKNVTVPSESVKHSGKYSIELQSQFVGIGSLGKFAAGNVFVGEYLGTDGTDGILGWGRPFEARPKAMRLWVKYTPQNVTRIDGTLPSDINLKKGDPDQGQIYIALLDNSVQKTYDGKTYPVIIKTKTRELFSKNDSNVVAYGEKVFTEATDGLVQIEIPIDYYRSDVRPSYIVITASASRYGDYFAGGPSVMNIDDIELIY